MNVTHQWATVLSSPTNGILYRVGDWIIINYAGFNYKQNYFRSPQSLELIRIVIPPANVSQPWKNLTINQRLKTSSIGRTNWVSEKLIIFKILIIKMIVFVQFENSSFIKFFICAFFSFFTFFPNCTLTNNHVTKLRMTVLIQFLHDEFASNAF